MLLKHVLYLVTGYSLIVPSITMAADATGNAPEKTQLCSQCHGANGISANPKIPNLASQKKGYILKALGDFRSGKREDVMMSTVAKGLSETEIEELATYYSGL